MLVLKVQADGATEMEAWAVIGAVQYAIGRGARLVNCSFGGEAYNQAEFNAFAGLRNAGALAVCAAGNDGINTDAVPNYPSSYNLDNVVSVAASDQNDLIASFSNFGLVSVDVMAPGVSIKSTTPINSPAPDSLTYGVKSGTSMAAPFVTGIAGLILSKNPTLDFAGIKSALFTTVDKIPAVEAKISSGGRVNALAALCGTLSVAGDLSLDNKVGLEDAIIALQIVSSTGSNLPVCPVSLAPAMDIDGDGTIGLHEAIYVLRKVAGLSN
jgi:subtilisin family serine protease